MRVTATVAEHLRLLQGEDVSGDDLAAGLSKLGRDVVLAVPSCLTVTIALASLGVEIDAWAVDGATAPVRVLASLAVPLSAVVPGAVLVLRAGEPGAFLPLADDLGTRLGPNHPPLAVDQHLTWPAAVSSESFPASLAGLRVVNQAVGVLVDRGLPPETVRRELQRRASDANTDVATASRRLLASLRPDPG
ncbi:ANTAR domain-containing protein [Parafrankia soli]|uniref:ANTAR domain-containing protein n=1 Tax=Parafrankia soli TaxID=2599596 RepID=UPI001041C842|nr:ANTAR domain-containing protein [Parafrankia soli]